MDIDDISLIGLIKIFEDIYLEINHIINSYCLKMICKIQKSLRCLNFKFSKWTKSIVKSIIKVIT